MLAWRSGGVTCGHPNYLVDKDLSLGVTPPRPIILAVLLGNVTLQTAKRQVFWLEVPRDEMLPSFTFMASDSCADWIARREGVQQSHVLNTSCGGEPA